MFSLFPNSFGAYLLCAALLAQAPPDRGPISPAAGPISKDAPQADQTPAPRDRNNNNFSGGSAGTFPNRPLGDKASVARGQKAYKTNCEYCHGDDGRGGDNGGPNIIRSDYLMKDRDGEVLRAFLLNKTGTGHSGVREGSLKFDFTKGQASDIASYVTDIAAFIHEFKLSSRDPGRLRPPTIVVGDPKAGEGFFTAHCASCHSASRDLKGIATRIADPRTLQQTWLMPRIYGRGPSYLPVTVTTSSGERIEGRLTKLDDFNVSLVDATGKTLSFSRDRDIPKVEVHDPMVAHRELLSIYSDDDIHNVTAWMVTLK